METFVIRDLSFTYPSGEKPALSGISFSVDRGEFVVLCGPSGCGKTTLLRQLKTVLSPHGERTGEILFEGRPLDGVDQRTQSARIGFVRQSPEDQIVTDKVWHELAFGLESLGFDTPAIRGRVAEMASFFGIESWFHRNVSELSGGQKQLLNLASIMAMQPSVLVLDEPTSQLDPIAASDFLAAVGRINRELGTTVIMTEQRLEEVFPMSDRVLVMDGGRLIAEGAPEEVGSRLRESGHPMFLAMPCAMRVFSALGGEGRSPVTVREGREWLEKQAVSKNLRELPDEKKDGPSETALELSEVWFRYDRNGADVLRGASLSVRKGELFALLGGNGAGKTTALNAAAGLRKPYRGSVKASGSLGVLPQDPRTLFVKKTVREDLREVFDQRHTGAEELGSRIGRVSSLCRLGGLLERHPYDLSRGEQQRAALAKVLLTEPEILLLDEPTKGLDAEFKQELAGILSELKKRGTTVFMVSHDVEFCAEFADRCALMFDGTVVTEGTPREFFSGNSFYTTSASRMARETVPGAVTVNDIVYAFGGELPPRPKAPEPGPEDGTGTGGGKDKDTVRGPVAAREKASVAPKTIRSGRPEVGSLETSQRLPKRTVAAAVMILLLIPLTIWAGVRFFGGRKYYAIALLVLFETMLPFALVFEGRKPQARELVTIAVVCAIGVAGRAAFFMLPNFKPVLAIVIIAGVALGAETGFLVGAVTMLVSNMLFGQGPWTPWQMFAMGITGFLAGLLFRRGPLCRNRLVLCVFGALSALIIYGGIMNPAAALMWSQDLDLRILLSYYATGLPVDLVHAAATALFLWIGARPLLEKLDRIKLKYGLLV